MVRTYSKMQMLLCVVTSTCRQTTMQMYRVCKCAKDWRQQRSSANYTKDSSNAVTTPVVSSLTYCIASMLQCSAIELQTQFSRIVACLQEGVTKWAYKVMIRRIILHPTHYL